MTLSQALELARGHAAAGELPQAEGVYRQILQVDPTNHRTAFELGRLYARGGHHDAAVQLFVQAIHLNPQTIEYYLELGELLRQKQRYNEAVDVWQRAATMAPADGRASLNLARLMLDSRRPLEAMRYLRRVIEVNARHSEAHAMLGAALDMQGDRRQAIDEAQLAVDLDPANPLAHRVLGAALEKVGRVDESVTRFRTALTLGGPNLDTLSGLSVALRKLGRFEESASAAREALKIRPGHASAHGSLALALLTMGNLEQGLAEYEWRWGCDDFPNKPREHDQPMWDGSDPSGRIILVYTEQGFGDAIQFARYVPLLAARGAKVILECQPELKGLFKQLPGVTRVTNRGQLPAEFDLHCPVLGLPHRFGTTLKTIPSQAPYLTVEPALIESWRARIPVREGKLKVGLIWGGRPLPDPNRSCPLAAWAGLGKVDGVALYNLQTGEAAAEARTPPPGMELVHLGEGIANFADTAAIMMNMDLIITIDTAGAHLAGALGRRTWTMLPAVADWRWLVGREDSPWYPTMRLWRQVRAGDWKTVVDRIAGGLADFAGGHPAS